LIQEKRKTRKTLSPEEIRALLTWLRNDPSVQGLENFAIVFMLVISGIRGEEL
jgi:integrase